MDYIANKLIDEVKEGDKVRGSWRSPETLNTYSQEGIIISNPETGLWVQSSDGGITPVTHFFFLKIFN